MKTFIKFDKKVPVVNGVPVMCLDDRYNLASKAVTVYRRGDAGSGMIFKEVVNNGEEKSETLYFRKNGQSMTLDYLLIRVDSPHGNLLIPAKRLDPRDTVIFYQDMDVTRNWVMILREDDDNQYYSYISSFEPGTRISLYANSKYALAPFNESEKSVSEVMQSVDEAKRAIAIRCDCFCPEDWFSAGFVSMVQDPHTARLIRAMGENAEIAFHRTGKDISEAVKSDVLPIGEEENETKPELA